MTLELTCAECETTFEIDAQDLADDPKTLVCANCDAKAPPRKSEALAGALEDLTHALQDLAPKFEISLTAETDDLPTEGRGASRGGKTTDKEEDEDDEDADEDEELEFGE